MGKRGNGPDGTNSPDRKELPGFRAGTPQPQQLEDELALRDSEPRFRSLVNDINLLAVMLDRQGRITFCNRCMLAVTGWTYDEIFGQIWYEVLLPEERREEMRRIYQIQPPDKVLPARHKHEILTHNGVQRMIDWKNTPIRNQAGEVICIASLGEDITEIDRHEKEDRFKAAILDSMRQAAIVTDPGGIILYWNAFAEELYGWLAQEVLGLDVMQLMVPQTGLDEAQKIMDHLRQGQPWKGEFVVRRKNGEIFLADVINSPVHDRAGQLSGIVVVSSDISERKRAEEALRWELSVNRSLAEVTQTLLTAASLDEISLQMLNHARMFTASPLGFVGYVEEGKAGFHSPGSSAELDEFCKTGQMQIHASQQPIQYCEWIRTNKKPLLVRPSLEGMGSASIQKEISGPPFLGVPAMIGEEVAGIIALANAPGGYHLRDRRALERLAVRFALAIQQERDRQKLALKTEELAHSNQELEQFAYIASHDLQEPLRKIHSFLELLEKVLPPDKLDEKAQKYLYYVKDASIRMQALIVDLLDYSRLTRGELQKEDVSLEAIVRQVMEDLSTTIEETGARVGLDSLPIVRVNSSQIGRVFQNLISNAMKFRRTDPPAVNISAVRDGETWLIRVQDNGLGIEPHYWERIFLIFQRLHTRQEYPGTGIGLAICKKIIERHGGKIWVESIPGEGSDFKFTLPLWES